MGSEEEWLGSYHDFVLVQEARAVYDTCRRRTRRRGDSGGEARDGCSQTRIRNASECNASRRWMTLTLPWNAEDTEGAAGWRSCM